MKASKYNFDRVKEKEIEWKDIDVNLRLFSFNYGIRLGDENDVLWLEDEMHKSNNSVTFRSYATALSHMTHASLTSSILNRVR